MAFNIKNFDTKAGANDRYSRRIARLKHDGKYTDSIEAAVGGATKNILEGKTRSFVIYGEPQSGKTEMMIALTARLLDSGHKIIIVMMNDSVQLLGQNLRRFQHSGLDPAPKNFRDILDPAVEIGEKEWVIFCKKNSSDLQKLIQKLGTNREVVIIDDEADFASPNAKINKGERTKINSLIGTLLGTRGIYIGVTATPGRLDLNNTFENDNEKWIDFPPHPLYKGQTTFFPTPLDPNDLGFRLETLPDQGDHPKYLRDALFRFLIAVAYLNLKVNEHEINYSMLIHTSGKKADHTEDYKQVIRLFSGLANPTSATGQKFYARVFELAKLQHQGLEHEITQYIIDNNARHSIVVMNSASGKNVDYSSATSPATLFTLAIGGNIVSRGVTFDNLLSMFFTRDVKHRIQQDTYIQRARMFGSRGEYLSHFELSIPEKLYVDWHKCFIFHRLALASWQKGDGVPVWLEDKRIAAASSSSIDRASISLDAGEMSFRKFNFTDKIDSLVDRDIDSFKKLAELQKIVGSPALPDFLIQYIQSFSVGQESIAIHKSRSIAGYGDADQEEIRRKKGFIGQSDLEASKFPSAVHHVRVLFNKKGAARVFYKYDGSIKFLKKQAKSS